MCCSSFIKQGKHSFLPFPNVYACSQKCYELVWFLLLLLLCPSIIVSSAHMKMAVVFVTTPEAGEHPDSLQYVNILSEDVSSSLLHSWFVTTEVS